MQVHGDWGCVWKDAQAKHARYEHLKQLMKVQSIKMQLDLFKGRIQLQSSNR